MYRIITPKKGYPLKKFLKPLCLLVIYVSYLKDFVTPKIYLKEI